MTESKQGSRKNCQLTKQGNNKISRILQTEDRFAQAEGYTIYKKNGEVNISELSARLEGLDRRTVTNIINRKNVSESSLKNFVRQLKDKHSGDEKINEDDYELIEGKDYILCSENTNPRDVKKTSNLNNNIKEQLKLGLFDLNYKPQVRFFEDTINTLTTGSFLIHGDMNHGQKWLVNRLSYKIPYHDSAFREPIRLRRDHIKTGKLWQDLAKKLNTTYNNSLDNLAQSIYKQAQNSTVILSFHNIDILTNQDQQKLFNFCSIITHNQQNVNYPIIIFLTSDISINATNNEHFFDVPVLRIFEPVEIIHWVRTHGNLFTDEQARDPTLKTMINDIIDHYNQNPITVFSRIAQYCNLDWTDIEGTFSL